LVGRILARNRPKGKARSRVKLPDKKIEGSSYGSIHKFNIRRRGTHSADQKFHSDQMSKERKTCPKTN
jgi:hypothetical protein